MPRKMYVTDEMGLDDALADIADASIKCALMWPWIVPYFDDWGRAEANARRIKGKIFPNFEKITFSDVEGMLTEFAAAGLIQLYEADGKRYMAVEREKWFRFQTHIHASKRTGEGSRYPAPPSEAIKQEVEVAREIAEPREDARYDAEPRASPSPSPSPSLTPSLSPSEEKKDAVLRNTAAAMPPKSLGKESEKARISTEKKDLLGQEAVAAYQERYQKRYGGRCEFVDGDTVSLKNLRINLGEEKFYRSLDNFMACEHPHVLKRRHPVAMLKGELNVWLSEEAIAQSYPALLPARASPSSAGGQTWQSRSDGVKAALERQGVK